ncbi:RNA-binding protein Nova-1 (Neuro-oncological ventral antigen 1) (Fragment) [Durusdinium trenchii]|uniref:RNA-binding protein Nova-1 (Neuro-oncological ventral antigen 1) n=1 Tax=Durusdinium trenchii TaxID=1381693 RepID=A0ABP0MHN2_9DINO
MKRSYEESGHSSGSKWSRRDTGLRMKYCLKALIPDVFASSLLRDKGALKEQLQEESGSRLVFSNKGDFFPDTSLRVLGIYSDLSGAVAQALELILGRMKELAQDERGRYPPPGCEMLGKEEGELIFRLVLSREMTGLLIGSQGARIKQLRQDSGCKVRQPGPNGKRSCP